MAIQSKLSFFYIDFSSLVSNFSQNINQIKTEFIKKNNISIIYLLSRSFFSLKMKPILKILIFNYQKLT